MIDITCQYNKSLNPFGPEDQDLLSGEYKKNEVLRCKITRVSKAMMPSLIQSNLLHACFKLVAENNDSPQLGTLESVKLACKIGIDFRDPKMVFVRPDGMVQFQYRSLNFRDLKGPERDKILDKCFEWLADVLGISVDEMVAEAKTRMLRKGNASNTKE